MIRSSVVLPEPDGPSSASNSPLPTFRSTLSSAANAPNFLTMFLTSMVTAEFCPSSRRRSRTVFTTSVISASIASSEAIANDATN